MFRSFAPENFADGPAGQVRTGDAYAWTGHFNQNVTGTANGLNQLTSVGPKSLTHDAKGNVTAFGTKSFTYSSENLLLTGPGSASLAYDPVMRLQQLASGGATAKFAYDGLDRIAEYDASNALQRRYVHGPNDDDPIVWYEGSGTADRRFLGSDERGSIISVTDSAGTVLALNKYDEFGQPQATNLGTFGYTGQAWLPTLGLWHYKARAYDPELGRFLQTDPIGYKDSPNLYAYVLNDPVNSTDPLGLASIITVTGWRYYRIDTGGGAGTGMGQTGSGQSAGQLGLEMRGEAESDEPIVVIGEKKPKPKPAPSTQARPPVILAAAPQGAAEDWCGNKDIDAPEGVWADACRRHDRCYGTIGVPKGECDRAFVADIIRSCQRTGVSCIGIAIIYGFSVWVFGDESYEEGQKIHQRGR